MKRKKIKIIKVSSCMQTWRTHSKAENIETTKTITETGDEVDGGPITEEEGAEDRTEISICRR